jgi:putative membrane protein
VPRGQRSRAVEAQAFHHFTRQGVMNTEDRSGVLVLICLFEHEVAILADQGIHQRVSVEYWKEETERLSRELKQGGDLTCVLIEGISRLGALLAKNFPRDPDSRNELANRPVIGE